MASTVNDMSGKRVKYHVVAASTKGLFRTRLGKQQYRPALFGHQRKLIRKMSKE